MEKVRTPRQEGLFLLAIFVQQHNFIYEKS